MTASKTLKWLAKLTLRLFAGIFCRFHGNATKGSSMFTGLLAATTFAYLNIFYHSFSQFDSRNANRIIILKLTYRMLQLPRTITRILLNHFKWDKEKLMEKYFDGNEDKFFQDAHVVNPFNKPNTISVPKVTICFVMRLKLGVGFHYLWMQYGFYVSDMFNRSFRDFRY